jgi:large subunit ribosomal protein L18
MGLTKLERRTRLKKRIRRNIFGTSDTPRLSVYRSNKQIYAQVVDDISGKTLCSASSLKIKEAQNVNKVEQAKFVGKELASKAKEAGIESVIFDRNGYLYHGRVKSLAEAAREGGLKF